MKKKISLIFYILFFLSTVCLSQDKELPLQIIKGPYLQNVKKDSITIMWETNKPSDSMIEYGITSSYGAKVEDKEAKTIHEITITGLKEETLYHYRVISGGVFSEDCTFKTAIKKGTPFRFAVWGDNRTDFFHHTKVARGIKRSKPDIAINVGDVVTNGEVYEQWGTEYFIPIREFAKNIPTYIAIGNHERNSHWYYDFVSQPNNEAWFAFTYGNSRFIILDTNQSYASGSEQGKWLRKELKSEEYKNATWHFVFFHHPPYSEGWDSPGYEGEIGVRLILVPMFEKYKVDIVFNGHTHDYERGYLNGVYYIITGGGGASLDTFQQDIPHITVYKSTYQFCTVDVKGNKLEVSARDMYNKVFDSFVIEKK